MFPNVCPTPWLPPTSLPRLIEIRNLLTKVPPLWLEAFAEVCHTYLSNQDETTKRACAERLVQNSLYMAMFMCRLREFPPKRGVIPQVACAAIHLDVYAIRAVFHAITGIGNE